MLGPASIFKRQCISVSIGKNACSQNLAGHGIDADDFALAFVCDAVLVDELVLVAHFPDEQFPRVDRAGVRFQRFHLRLVLRKFGFFPAVAVGDACVFETFTVFRAVLELDADVVFLAGHAVDRHFADSTVFSFYVERVGRVAFLDFKVPSQELAGHELHCGVLRLFFRDLGCRALWRRSLWCLVLWRLGFRRRSR